MLKAQMTELLQKEQLPEWISFLRTLDKTGKKELIPLLHALLKDCSQIVQVSNNTYGQKGKAPQSNMLQVAAFVCMNRADYEKTPYTIWLISKENLDPVLGWYCPDWFSDFVNSQAANRELPYNLTYAYINELTEGGYLHPTPELLAKALHDVIYERRGREVYYTPDVLLLRPVTLNEHIWYLFQYETNIHLFERYIHNAHDIEPEQPGWLLAFRGFIDSGHINRGRLLREALLASGNNFNKLVSGWFAELFTGLQPTPQELLALQQELFTVLHSPHSKPVNTALDGLKKISGHANFNSTALLEQAPALLSSDTKSLVSAVLALLEKLAATHASLRPSIAALAAQVFIHTDETLQTRAAKLIYSLRKDLDERFPEKLAPYRNRIKLTAKNILGELPEATGPAAPAPTVLPATTPAAETPALLPVTHSLDDFFFLASQAFDNNYPWHIDALPAALLQWCAALQGEASNRLEPALQRALHTCSRDGLRAGQGLFDRMLAYFFIDVCRHLIHTHPAQTAALQQVLSRMEAKEHSRPGSGFITRAGGQQLFYWNTADNSIVFQPHKSLLLAALAMFQTNSTLPLLSTPTHEPGRVDPVTLVQRLAAWQQAGQEPDSIDLQIALSRCHLQQNEEATRQATALLRGEWLHLLLFLLGTHPEPQGPFVHTAAWLTASLALADKQKHPALEPLGYYREPFDYYSGRYNWQLREEKVYNGSVQDADGVKTHIYISKYVLFPIVPAAARKLYPLKESLLYDYIGFPQQRVELSAADIPRLLLLAPNNPGPVLAQLLVQELVYNNFYEASGRDIIVAAIHTLYQLWGAYGYAEQVFLATCMLSGDKTVCQLAAETWLKGVGSGHINQQYIGGALGLQLGGNYAPLQRFNGVLEQQLIGVSALHNRQLQDLVEELLAVLPDVPVKHLKKLLEWYTEVLIANTSTATNAAVNAKLATWQQTATLQKTIGLLLKV